VPPNYGILIHDIVLGTEHSCAGTTSRFLVKEIFGTSQGKSVYDWQDSAFVTLWYCHKNMKQKPTQILLCFGLSAKMEKAITAALESSDPSAWCRCPLGIYAVLVPVIAECFDRALWGFREPIRSIETVN
jgi:hypothetical protein